MSDQYFILETDGKFHDVCDGPFDSYDSAETLLDTYYDRDVCFIVKTCCPGHDDQYTEDGDE